MTKTVDGDGDQDGDFEGAGHDTTTRTDYHVDKQNHTGYAQVFADDACDNPMELACEEFGFVPRTGSTEFVVAASATVFSGGMALSEVSNQLRGMIDPLRESRNGQLLSGTQANRTIIDRRLDYARTPPSPKYFCAAEAGSLQTLPSYGSISDSTGESQCYGGPSGIQAYLLEHDATFTHPRPLPPGGIR